MSSIPTREFEQALINRLILRVFYGLRTGESWLAFTLPPPVRITKHSPGRSREGALSGSGPLRPTCRSLGQGQPREATQTATQIGNCRWFRAPATKLSPVDQAVNPELPGFSCLASLIACKTQRVIGVRSSAVLWPDRRLAVRGGRCC
jgi:hypothetical protein